MPLPISLISPILSWRQGHQVSDSGSITLCVVQTMVVPRLQINSELSATAFQRKDWQCIQAMAMDTFSKGTVSILPPPEKYVVKEVEQTKTKIAILEQALYGSPRPLSSMVYSPYGHVGLTTPK